ncbi:RNA polymerase II elongation factor ELL-like isoform X2 [Rhipicephalus microplus]|uniref:RNA polymerase II elongation factor ELL-like isoform X2 n=1 Tax=Rhipicephalus microplus TaxID=6941 RepID=UPI003F6C3A5D
MGVPPQISSTLDGIEVTGVSPAPHLHQIPQTKFQIRSKYTEITSEEQRYRYKADFNAEYEEYKALHSTIESVSKRFSDLEECLRTAREGTEQWNHVAQQIMKAYEETERDQQYQHARQKFEYLHHKLAHIKCLVMDYDLRSRKCPEP